MHIVFFKRLFAEIDLLVVLLQNLQKEYVEKDWWLQEIHIRIYKYS